MVTTVKPDMTRIWAGSAPVANIEDPDTTSPGKFTDGWEAEIPPFENFNFLQQLFTQSAAYFNENGISEWDTNTNYPQYGIARGSNGTYYQSVIEQTGNDPISDDGTNWIVWLADIKAGRKNAIINGNFDIWQRGVSQTLSGYGSDDRWYNYNVGTTKVASQQTFTLGQTDVPNNSKYYSRTVVTSVAGAANLCNKVQRLEGVNSFSGETVMVSFYAKADAAKDIAVEFRQVFGTGGSPSADVNITPQTITLSTAWQKFTVAFTISSVSGKKLGSNGDDYLQLGFWFDAGSNYDARTDTLGQQSGTFDIAQVQIEKGSVATEFERRPIGQELELCKRYFERLTHGGSGWPYTGQAVATTIVWWGINYSEKRAIPSSIILVTSGTPRKANGDLPPTGSISSTTIAAVLDNSARVTSVWSNAQYVIGDASLISNLSDIDINAEL